MEISLVMAVLNQLNLTKNCYEHIRKVYPDAPLVISSGGSNDGTKEWLLSLNDDNLSYIHDDDVLTFSDNYNTAIKLVDTEKLVLIHNDMVISKGFLETLDKLLNENEDTLISYTTIEPPIFKDHNRPGKLIYDLGDSFETFDYNKFEEFINTINYTNVLYDGATFFMSGYKKIFEDIGGFDGFTFAPAFCEDDDFLIRAKLKKYKLKTTTDALVYHFVSKTSRFGNDFKNKTNKVEINSNRNFIRKWGIPISMFNYIDYQNDEDFDYKTFNISIILKSEHLLGDIEPYFDKIKCTFDYNTYIAEEQKYTNYDLNSKFLMCDFVDVVVYEKNFITEEDYQNIQSLRLILPKYEIGTYEIGNLIIEIKKELN